MSDTRTAILSYLEWYGQPQTEAAICSNALDWWQQAGYMVRDVAILTRFNWHVLVASWRAYRSERKTRRCTSEELDALMHQKIREALADRPSSSFEPVLKALVEDGAIRRIEEGRDSSGKPMVHYAPVRRRVRYGHVEAIP